MAKRLLGKTVYYRHSRGGYSAAIISAIPEDGLVCLFVMQPGLIYVASVEMGYGVGQWQHPELIPHDDIGNPIPTDGPETEGEQCLS